MAFHATQVFDNIIMVTSFVQAMPTNYLLIYSRGEPCTIDFKLNLFSHHLPQSVLLVEPSPPPSPQPVMEPEHPNHFTVEQLMSLHQQLKALAPSGFMLSKDLVDTLMRLANQTLGGDKLPDNWKTVTREQVQSHVHTS